MQITGTTSLGPPSSTSETCRRSLKTSAYLGGPKASVPAECRAGEAAQVGVYRLDPSRRANRQSSGRYCRSAEVVAAGRSVEDAALIGDVVVERRLLQQLPEAVVTIGSCPRATAIRKLAAPVFGRHLSAQQCEYGMQPGGASQSICGRSALPVRCDAVGGDATTA